MATANHKPLPTPHDSIRVHARRYWRGVYIEYRAPSLDALLEAGCITQTMLDRLNHPDRGRPRVDAEGDRFSRMKRRSGVLVTRHIRNDDGQAKALALPGVAACLGERQPDPEEAQPWIGRAAEAAQVMGTAADRKERSRAVGRFQRVVSWVTIQGVVFPDWPTIQALAARGAP